MKKVTCSVCGVQVMNISAHVESKHSLSLDEYLKDYCNDAVINDGGKGGEKIGSSVLKISSGVSKDVVTMIPSLGYKHHFQDWMENVVLDLQKEKPSPVMLIGHTGCGKTSSLLALAEKAKQPVIRTNLNGQTTISDFVGTWVVKDGSMEWIDGVLPKAMRVGAWLILDEIDFAEPAILSLLNAVLEPNGTLCLKEKNGEIVEPHKNFRIMGTANAVGAYAEYRHLYQGCNLLNEAFLNRWRCYTVDYLSADLEVQVLREAFPKLTSKIAEKMVQVANDCRKAFEEETLQCTFSTRVLLDWAEMILRHVKKHKENVPAVAAKMVIYPRIGREDAKAIEGIIQRVFG